MTSISPVLQIENLSIRLPKGADRKFAVENVNIDLHQGETLCLVGESGSGKSTIAFTIMGLQEKVLTVHDGSILLDGQDLTRMSPGDLRQLRCARMSMIFQEPMTALNPVMRCGKQIEEVLSIHTDLSKTQRQEQIEEIIRTVGLPDVERILKSYPHQLSGGQRQRIMIAMALVLRPILLIADEPTTALDVTTQAQILAEIDRLKKIHNTSVLFITHDFGVVAEIADRVAVLKDGHLVEMGDKESVLKYPQDPYTKKLIQAVPSLIPRAPDVEDHDQVVLEVSHIAKRYPGAKVLAVNNFSLMLNQGETIGIVGESGSGKTTAARCIATLETATKGEITVMSSKIDIRRSDHLRIIRKNIQYIYQDPYRSLNPRRTILDSLIEGPMNYGVSRQEATQACVEMMRMVGLSEDALHRFPHEFSGGQRQRISIARALIMRPTILIADEAVSALDVSIQAQILKLLQDIQKKLNVAIIFITHDLRVAAQLCDRLIIMRKGDIVETGETGEVFRNPRHEYTRLLLDSVPGKSWNFNVHNNTKYGNE